MGTRWRGLLAPLGTSTGDGRRFLPGGVTHRELPMALKWQRTDEMGHDNSVVIGMCETIDMSDTEVWGEGELFDDVDPAQMPRLAEDVAEAKLLTSKGVIGPSVDPGAAAACLVEIGADEPITEERLDELLMESWDTGQEPPLEVLFTQYEIAAATLVTIPAFAECRPFELLEPAALTAAVRSTGWSDMPLASRERAWDAAAATGRLSSTCGLDGDNPDWDCYASGFLFRDDSADTQTKGAYGLPIVDVIDGAKTIVPRGVFAAAGALQGSHGNTPAGMSDDQTDQCRKVISGLYKRMAKEFDDDTIVAPWDEASMAVRVALTSAAAVPDAALFADPNLSEITPLTVQALDNGWRRVFGHIATHDTCHVGIREVCTTAPDSQRGYVDFHRYSQTAAGVPLPVAAGRITAGHGQHTHLCGHTECRGNDDHACNLLRLAGAIAHHDQMRTLAYVCVGKDEANNAIWMAGIVAPQADERDLRALGRRKVSGDWREVAGHLELVEVLALSRERPGFPLPRARMADGQPLALTAAGAVRPRPAAAGRLGLDYERLGKVVAAELAARIAGTDPPAEPAPEPPAPVTAPLIDEEVLARVATAARLAGETRGTVDDFLADLRARQAADLLAEVEAAQCVAA